MRKIETFSASRFLLLCSLLAFLILLASCNLRENPLLPPNLDPKDYVIGNTIRVYSDYLVKSSNDDSFLYIPKESISDSLLWYGDTIIFQRTEGLLERDSLALVEASLAVTNTYEFTIQRAGQKVVFDDAPAFATLYTQLTAASEYLDIHLLSLRYKLKAAPASVYPYGFLRAFFDLDGNGEISLVNFNHGSTLRISAGARDVEALLVHDADLLQTWIPSEFMAEQGELTLSLVNELQSSQVSAVQAVFPGFAMQSKVLKLSTEHSVVSDSVPILHYYLSGEKRFDAQWIKLNGSRLDSWESGDQTWIQSGEQLTTFMNGAGYYFLACPLEAQNSLSIPLDGSLGQIYLPGLWLDLSLAPSPGYSLNLVLPTLNQGLPQDYFSGNPFTLSGAYQSFGINLTKGREPVESLPEGNWFEFGFYLENAIVASTRLSRIYRSTSLDHLDYKSFATDYDEAHFTTSGEYLYCGINSSGTYILGNITDSATSLEIPCLKPELQLQTSRTHLSWSDSSLPCSTLSLAFNAPITEAHPWLNGYPYSFSGSSLLKLSAANGDTAVDTIPENLFISYALPRRLSSVINFSPSAVYPQFYRYQASSGFAHNTFVYSGGKMQISPATTGYLIDASALSRRGSGELELFGRMVWDDYDWELYLDSRRPMRRGTILSFSSASSFTDTYGVLAGQYSLSYLSPVYKFRILNNPAFYSGTQPYIRLRQSSRRNSLLFSEIAGDFYRIYSYPSAAQADGWNFALSDGHAAFVLPHDGEFAAVTDNEPHNEIDAVVTGIEDLHASLYQAQFVLPGAFVGTLIPLGSHFTLRKLQTIPPGITATSAYQLQIRGPQLNILNPSFYNYPEQPRFPYLYLPIPEFSPGQIPELFYRDQAGVVTQLNYVPSFSENPTTEFSIVGNCVVCFVNNPGIFFFQ